MTKSWDWEGRVWRLLRVRGVSGEEVVRCWLMALWFCFSQGMVMVEIEDMNGGFLFTFSLFWGIRIRTKDRSKGGGDTYMYPSKRHRTRRHDPTSIDYSSNPSLSVAMQIQANQLSLNEAIQLKTTIHPSIALTVLSFTVHRWKGPPQCVYSKII